MALLEGLVAFGIVLMCLGAAFTAIIVVCAICAFGWIGFEIRYWCKIFGHDSQYYGGNPASGMVHCPHCGKSEYVSRRVHLPMPRPRAGQTICCRVLGHKTRYSNYKSLVSCERCGEWEPVSGREFLSLPNRTGFFRRNT